MFNSNDRQLALQAAWKAFADLHMALDDYERAIQADSEGRELFELSVNVAAVSRRADRLSHANFGADNDHD